MSVRKRNKIITAILVIFFVAGLSLFVSNKIINRKLEISIDLDKYTFVVEKEEKKQLKEYKLDDYDNFIKDYKNGKLPYVYLTEFLFDGVSMYKPYDLDDFIEKGNDIKVDDFKINVLNINCSHDIKLTGEMKGMIAVNSNNLIHDITLYLNNVKVDTDSKKVPAVYVYNKDVNYSKHKVIISTIKNTTNTLEGGKLKKVSLVGSDELSLYSDKYSGDVKDIYNKYTNYYGIYKKNDINNILFAKVNADSEDLKDGDPIYFYKASGAVSSDIDLYFVGEGKLSVISKNNEGIETKGNLKLTGKKGDYYVSAMDDCLNTTTKTVDNNQSKDKKSTVRNSIVIDVSSLVAIVSKDAKEGDAIDSNGTLTINGGKIIAIAKTGSDAGLDSESGTYINGGTIIATGDMFDEISSESKQTFIGLSFKDKMVADDLLLMTDSSNNVIYAYKTDREYTNFVYSSELLEDESYYLFKNGKIVGEDDNGYYSNATAYDRGTVLGYSSKGILVQNGLKPQDNKNPGDVPSEPPKDDKKPGDIPSEKANEEIETISNKEFKVSGISNLFSGIGIYLEKSS